MADPSGLTRDVTFYLLHDQRTGTSAAQCVSFPEQTPAGSPCVWSELPAYDGETSLPLTLSRNAREIVAIDVPERALIGVRAIARDGRGVFSTVQTETGGSVAALTIRWPDVMPVSFTFARADDRPIGGATVVVFDETLGRPGKAVALGSTTAEGAIVVMGFQGGRRYHVDVGVGGRVHSFPVDVTEALRSGRVLIRLPPPGEPRVVTVEVTDATGQPLPGAVVQWIAPSAERAFTATNAEGVATGRVGESDVLGIWVSKHGFRSRTYPPGALLPSRIMLERQSRLVVELQRRTPETKAMAMAIRARDGGPPPSETEGKASNPDRVVECVVSGGDGAVHMDDLLPGTYDIEVRDEGGTLLGSQSAVVVEDGRTVSVVVSLE